MHVEHARYSLLTLLELAKGNTLYIGDFPSITRIMNEFKGNGYTVDYVSQTVKYHDNVLMFGTVRSEKDVYKYMGLEVNYMYIPSSMDSMLSKWLVAKLRGNSNCLFIYDYWN